MSFSTRNVTLPDSLFDFVLATVSDLPEETYHRSAQLSRQEVVNGDSASLQAKIWKQCGSAQFDTSIGLYLTTSGFLCFVFSSASLFWAEAVNPEGKNDLLFANLVCTWANLVILRELQT